jgi:hypothetical protein
MFRKHFKFRRRLFVGLAFAAFAAPAAQASTGYFVDGGPAPVSTPSHPIAAISERSATSPSQLQVQALRWEAIAKAYQQPAAASSERSYGVRGPDPSLVPQVASATSTGFDWGDAGIGASTAFGLALLLVIGTAIMRRNQPGGLSNA